MNTWTGMICATFVLFTSSYVSAGPPKDQEPATANPDDNSMICIETDDKYGFEWCIVSDPDNPPFPGHWQTGAFEGYGSIPYEYRLARTELTVAQY
jgi:hypothetical protein